MPSKIAESMAKGLKVSLGPLVYASTQTPPRGGGGLIAYDKLESVRGDSPVPGNQAIGH